ncbi:MAG: helix-turn-helix domain-containing protein [Chloroflexota bacterium]|nr:helix-turn-helix domain-containing protein [Chloroflexota bacterium]
MAADLGVSLSTVYEALRAGELPRIRVRGQWRIPCDRYERWRNGDEDLSRQTAQVIPLRRRTVGARA